MDLNEVATILGWSNAKVDQIAARYVTAQEIGWRWWRSCGETLGKRKL